jgi:hypothetical protein
VLAAAQEGINKVRRPVAVRDPPRHAPYRDPINALRPISRPAPAPHV